MIPAIQNHNIKYRTTTRTSQCLEIGQNKLPSNVVYKAYKNECIKLFSGANRLVFDFFKISCVVISFLHVSTFAMDCLKTTLKQKHGKIIWMQFNRDRDRRSNYNVLRKVMVKLRFSLQFSVHLDKTRNHSVSCFCL